MIRPAGRAPLSRTTRRSTNSTLHENNDTSATSASPPAGSQTPISDMQRWYRDSRVLLWRNPEPPQSTRKRETRSLLWDNTAKKKKGSPERRPKTSRRKRIGRQPPCLSSSRRAQNHGHISTSETGPPREDTGSWSVSSSQQSLPGDPSSRPRSETAGRDDEATNFEAIRAFLAPFDANNELGEWEFSKEEGRWWRENKTTNTIIWAPTADMFS